MVMDKIDQKENEAFIYPKENDWKKMIERVKAGKKPVGQTCFALDHEEEAFQGTRKDVNDFKKHVGQAKLDWQVRVNSSRDGGYTAIFHFYVPGAYLSDYWQQKSVMRFISLPSAKATVESAFLHPVSSLIYSLNEDVCNWNVWLTGLCYGYRQESTMKLLQRKAPKAPKAPKSRITKNTKTHLKEKGKGKREQGKGKRVRG